MTEGLQIYDTLSGTKRRFVPLDPEGRRVGMYVCGITVYDYCHLGHGRVFVAFDAISRHLRHLGYELDYIRNITDVDDKILKRAAEQGEEPTELTERFIAAMHEDFNALGMLPPDAEPRATGHIEGMLEIIGTLVEKGAAYQADNGDVYFSVEAFPDYGKLNRRKIEDSIAGARVAVNESKRHPADFVLWKSLSEDDGGAAAPLSWNSPWGRGRPGWHIECSAMSLDALGESFDIHGGGPDLKFPHHENEIAQSECASGKHFANNWMHAGALRLNSEKMSKSLGNFFTIRDVLGEVQPEVLRYFLLSSHYRSAIDYSSDALIQARRGLDRLYQSLRDLDAANTGNGVAKMPEGAPEKALAGFEADYLAAMNDDFNTSGAIAVLFAAARELNSSLRDASTGSAALGACLRQLGARLGLLELDPETYFSWQPAGVSGLSDERVAEMIELRKQAKSDGDYARSDAIRAALLEQGVELNDTREGVSWKRV